MGQLIDGQWVTDDALGSVGRDGRWKRSPSVLRGQIGADSDECPAEAGRYHLYAAWNCPWAHRVLLTRALLGLEHIIPVSYVAPRRTSEGWVFAPTDGYIDHHSHQSALHEVYTLGHSTYTGRVTVPLLIDTQSGRLVSNDSAELVRMLGDAFGDRGTRPRDLYPEPLRAAIDHWNDRIYPNLNNGVYRAGFAESQAAYDAAVHDVFDTLDAIEAQLTHTTYLTGDTFTEADLRLFPTLARFDVAYHTAFKCSRRRLVDYPHLWHYARRIYAMPGVADTVKFDIYRRGYFSKSAKRNPLGIIPVAPDIDWAL